MAFLVRRVGGGTFSARTLSFSPDDHFLFVGCGPVVAIYQVPDLTLFDHRTSHRSDVTALACSRACLISGDRSGAVLFHAFNEITGLDKAPSRTYAHAGGVERLFVRGDRVFIASYDRQFWLFELDARDSPFVIPAGTQRQLCAARDGGGAPAWLRFPALDAFDIDDAARCAVIGDGCTVQVYDAVARRRTAHHLFHPARLCRFRGPDVCVFQQNGALEVVGARRARDHWHFVCPNAAAADAAAVYSGGFEGVLVVWRERLNRHAFLPRLGLTIEALALTSDSAFVAAVVDRNTLALVDCGVLAVRSFVAHPCGDAFFHRHALVAVRRPNLRQFFDSRSGELLEQMQVSSYNSTVPLTAVDLSDRYLVTVETAGGNAPPQLTMAQQSEYNHRVPHADVEAATAAYLNMLTSRRHTEMLRMAKLSYAAQPETENGLAEIPRRFAKGNPLECDRREYNPVSYSEVKIWSKAGGVYDVEQSFRIIGKPVNALRLHPVFSLFAIAVERELQLWKLTSKWQLWKSSSFPSIPQAFLWSPDGSILVVQFSDLLSFFDISASQVIADQQFSCGILSAAFTSDYEIVVSIETGVSLFDLRSFSVTSHYFARPDCLAACGGAFAFAINGPQPRIVLSADKGMKSWQLPTVSRVRAIALTADKSGVRIGIVDEANVIWSVDEYGTLQEKEARLTTIASTPVERVQPQEKIAVKVDRTRQILEFLTFPSHQIPGISDLSPAFFGILLDKRPEPPATSVAIPADFDVVDESIGAVILTAPEMARLKLVLA
jgi:hypothetical protein